MGVSVVSTVFLGCDHNWSGEGPPVLFETMVFGGPLDEEQVRYCTLAEARAGHSLLCAQVGTTDWVWWIVRKLVQRVRVWFI